MSSVYAWYQSHLRKSLPPLSESDGAYFSVGLISTVIPTLSPRILMCRMLGLRTDGKGFTTPCTEYPLLHGRIQKCSVVVLVNSFATHPYVLEKLRGADMAPLVKQLLALQRVKEGQGMRTVNSEKELTHLFESKPTPLKHKPYVRKGVEKLAVTSNDIFRAWG